MKAKTTVAYYQEKHYEHSIHFFAVNYSATPVDKYNLLLQAFPVDAFRHNLVKK